MLNLQPFLVVVFLTATLAGQAQTNHEAIQQDFSQYIKFLFNKEFDRTMDYMVEELFEVAPRSSLVQMMEETFNNPEVDIALKDPKILNIGKIDSIEGKHYALVTYSMMMILTPKQQDDDTTRLESVKATLKQRFGTSNVSYDNESGAFNILSKIEIYAVSKNGTNNWKFILINKEQKALMEKLLPKRILDKM